MEINTSQVSSPSTQLLQASQSNATNEATETEVQSQTNPVSSDEQEPQISADGARLAATNNSTTTSDSPAISNSDEAQQVLNQLRDQIQASPAQTAQAQSNVSSALVASLVG